MSKKVKEVNQKKNYDKLVKALQIAAGVFMLAMVIIFIVLMKKYDISVKNVSAITDKLTGGIVTVAALIILFNLIKSFALIVTFMKNITAYSLSENCARFFLLLINFIPAYQNETPD